MTVETTFNEWRSALAIYKDRRLLVILLMGFSSGLPLLLGFSTLSYWLKAEGVSLTTIGWFLGVSTPYSLKFLWAPVFDHVRVFALTKRFGQRRSWLLVLQPLLSLSIFSVGMSDPKDGLIYMSVATLIMAFLSASQDVVVDAYRIEILDESEMEQGAGSSATQVGYRVGLLVSGAGAIAFSDYFSWDIVYAVMGTLMLVGIITTIIAEEPEKPTPAAADYSTGTFILQRLMLNTRDNIVTPIKEYWGRNVCGAFWVVLFILSYKYGDAVAGAMSYPFFLDMGFTGVEIASVTKIFGVCMAALGAIVGGFIVIRFGVIWSLLIGGIFQAITNLLFAYLATLGSDLAWLAIAIGADNFTGGLGSAAFVAFLSKLCNISFTATQFALFTSLMALSRILFATPSGWLADQIGWVNFFIATTVLAIPALCLVFVVRRYYELLLPTR